VPILPIALHGTRTALHKHDWRFGVSKAEARVLAPIETTGMTSDDVPALRDRVREVIAAEVASMRASTSA
jgi:1-acyl-sn-glycerol-3-phosphate acyltransferase